MAAVYLVGAGPGDPDLLTVKAHRMIQSADVILHDSLVDGRVLALAKPGAELVDVGKRCGKKSTAQARINALLCDAARRSRNVVRLKGGDPMVFGRADEEMGALEAAGIGYEIIPGITTATAAAAALRLSLTKRQVSRGVHFLTGHGADGALPAHDWVALAKSGGTLVVYMGARKMFGAAAHLIEAGMDPALPAVAVENAARPEQRFFSATVATLGSVIEAAAPSGPVLILIGEALRGRGNAPLVSAGIRQVADVF
jgi:uroporphyrin-III C-methyltransferase